MTHWWKQLDAERVGPGGTGDAVPPLTLDPELPVPLQELLRQADLALLRGAVTTEPPSPWWGLADPLAGRRGSWWFAWLLLSVFARSVLLVGAGACAYGLTSAVAVLKRRRRAAVRVQIAQVHDRFVLGSELDSEAAELLARAARAAAWVQRSSVQRLDPADKAHNDRRLDTQVWEIADGLRTYSRVAGGEPTEPASALVERALEPRRKILRTSLSSLGRRVEALEHYAAQIAEAEQRRREVRQLQHLTAGTDDLLDLLAATARDELAAAEIAEMGDEVATALELFAESLRAAQDAATAALPSLPLEPDQHIESV
ncbi:hypothetical protein OG923_33125 (plasmid) [Streptomyces halstedii]|uniref:hypothetical protein n=1 Tax=Streptomyces halstedii TaxID=1944 RepID=UPI002F90722B